MRGDRTPPRGSATKTRRRENNLAKLGFVLSCFRWRMPVYSPPHLELLRSDLRNSNLEALERRLLDGLGPHGAAEPERRASRPTHRDRRRRTGATPAPPPHTASMAAHCSAEAGAATCRRRRTIRRDRRPTAHRPALRSGWQSAIVTNIGRVRIRHRRATAHTPLSGPVRRPHVGLPLAGASAFAASLRSRCGG